MVQGDREIGEDVAGQLDDESYRGVPARLWRWLARHPPPGFARQRWRSPLRGPWLTSIFGSVLLVGLPIITITGLLSYVAYAPRFGQAMPAGVGLLRLPGFAWPTSPSWLYRLTEGVHVVGGMVLVPIVLAKLWSVVPKLFAWPPARSLAQLLERFSLVLLVGGILFEIVTGLLNTQYDYIFGFSFYTAHYYGAWVFIGGFVVHITMKIPVMVRSLRARSLRAELRTPVSQTQAEPADSTGLVATDPCAATVSRRGALGLVGGAAALVTVLTAGQSIGGTTRRSTLLLPRGRSNGAGPNGFPVNKTATAVGLTQQETLDWRLTLQRGSRVVRLDKDQLRELPQHTVRLPIACVEGWSTTQSWTGVRLRDLAARVGAGNRVSAHVRSLGRKGAFNRASLQANQVADSQALLALRVNGAELSLDHGYPARVIVPALPGVHNTKWVESIEFRSV